MRSLLLALLLLVPAASAQETALRTGRPVDGSIVDDGKDLYSFTAGRDFFVRGVVNQKTVDVVVRIVDEHGDQVARFDGPGRGPERFWMETDAEGTYTIEVSGFEGKTGDYTIVLERLEPVQTDPRKRTDQLLSTWDREDGPGAAVHVFRGGRTLYLKAYGMADLALGTPFTVDTPTNIGSTSKQFTAFAVLLLAEDGLLSLDDDVRKHIPELPDLGATVTVRNILTHTSGYREFLNLLRMAGRDIGHGDWIDRDEIVAIVQRQPKLQNAPGAEWNYNNTAFSLAATVVERVSGKPFHDFVRERIFAPLGMTSAMVRPTPEHQVPGRSMGYALGEEGTYLEKRDIGGSTGAGGIYVSVRDLKKWIDNYENPTVGTPGMVEQMTTRYILADGDTTGYGLGLGIDEHRGLKRVQHGGADVAHRSMLAWYPDIDAGITVQSNDASFDTGMAFTIAEAFFEAYMEPEEDASGEPSAFDPASYDPEAFDELAGRYALDEAPDFVLRFFREDDVLYTQATGQDRIEIRPTSDSTFALTVVDARVTFHRNAEGRVDALTLHQNGEHRATRLPEDEAPAAWAPTPEDLAAFAGRYLSEEVETFFTVAVQDSALVLKHRRMDDVTLRPGKADTFSSGAFSEVAFERDRNGEVIAFYLANGRTRDVRFRKLD